MKKLLLILFCGISFGVMAQDSIQKSRKIYVEFELLGNYSLYQKDKHLSTIYENGNIGFGIGHRLSYKKLYGIGVEYNRHVSTIENQSLIGNFNSGTFRQYSLFGFGRYPIAERFLIEGRIGGGELSIKHQTSEYDYKLNYNIFTVGTSLYYTVSEEDFFKIFLKYDQQFISNPDLVINAAEYEVFNKTNISQIGVGINISF